MTAWPVRVADSRERSCGGRGGECGSGCPMEWRKRGARCNVANLDADDVLDMVDLVGRAADDEDLLVLVGLRVAAELNVGARFSGNLWNNRLISI